MQIQSRSVVIMISAVISLSHLCSLICVRWNESKRNCNECYSRSPLLFLLHKRWWRTMNPTASIAKLLKVHTWRRPCCRKCRKCVKPCFTLVLPDGSLIFPDEEWLHGPFTTYYAFWRRQTFAMSCSELCAFYLPSNNHTMISIKLLWHFTHKLHF